MARAKGAQVAAEKAELERDISLVRNFVSAFVLALQLLLLSHLLPPPGCRRYRRCCCCYWFRRLVSTGAWAPRGTSHTVPTTHCCEASVGLQDFISRWCASLLPQVRAPDALLRNAAEGEKILVPVEEAPREAEEGMAE